MENAQGEDSLLGRPGWQEAEICSHKSKLLKKPCFCLVSPAKSSLAAVGGEEMGNAHVGLRAQWGGSMQITIKKLI